MKKNSEIRQSEIVGMAITIIGEMGASGLTTARLAERLNMSEPNLYRHFKDKEAILAAVIDEIGRAIKDRAARLAGQKVPPKKKLQSIMANHILELEQRSGIPRFVFSDEMHIRYPLLREKMEFCIAEYLSIVEKVLSEGKSDGTFRPDIEVGNTARTFLGMIQFAAMSWSLSGFSFSLRGYARRLCTNFCRMLEGDNGSIPPGAFPAKKEKMGVVQPCQD